MSIQEIEKETGYDIGFIIHVIKNYMIDPHKNSNNETEFDVAVEVTK